MRLRPITGPNLRRVALALALAGGFAAAVPAAAGGRHDHVYADSFGNLVVLGASGYKRIVVGQGHLAKELSDYTRAGAGPDVVYLDGEAEQPGRCRSEGVLLHGRSYMYGLAGDVVPVLVRPCP